MNNKTNIDLCNSWTVSLLEDLDSEIQTEIESYHDKILELEYQIKKIDEYEENFKKGSGFEESELENLTNLLYRVKVDKKEKIKVNMRKIIMKNIYYHNVITNLLNKIDPEKAELLAF